MGIDMVVDMRPSAQHSGQQNLCHTTHERFRIPYGLV